jgi:acetolactate synthase-1/3 small subunit
MKTDLITLELLVNNHPGVMMHVVSLFARRAFNMEGIACFPCTDPTQSRMWLRVKNDSQLAQIEAQLLKLIDVLEIHHDSVNHEAFVAMETFFSA